MKVLRDEVLITNCPTIEVRDIPQGMTAHVSPGGEIVIWDGGRQYHTGAEVEGPDLDKALQHHWATGWVGLEKAD